jgi:hypothetical protein
MTEDGRIQKSEFRTQYFAPGSRLLLLSSGFQLLNSECSPSPVLSPRSPVQSCFYFACGISILPMRLIASVSIFASLSQNFWNSGASR